MAEAEFRIKARDETRAAFDSVRRNFDALKGQGESLAGFYSKLFAGGSVLGLGALVKGAIDAADELNKVSQRVGVTVESLSALQYAGKLADVSNEQLAEGLKRLSVNAQEAAAGGKEAAAAFAQIGISQEELRRLSPDEILGRVADAYAQIEDGAGKTANAVKIGGRSFSELIPLLNGGSRGLQEAGDEARRFGLVVSSDTAKAAEQFNDNLTKLGATAQAVAFDLAERMLPGVKGFTDELVEGVRIFGSLGAALLNLGTINPFKTLQENIRGTRTEIERIESILRDLPSTAGRLRESFSGQLDAQKRRLEFLQFQQRQGIETGNPNTFDARDLAARAGSTRRTLSAAPPADKAASDPFALGNTRQAQRQVDIILGQFRQIADAREELQRDLEGKITGGAGKSFEEQYLDFRRKLDELLADTKTGRTSAITADLDVLNEALIQGRVTAQQYDEAFAGIEKRYADLEPRQDAVTEANDRQAESFAMLESAIRGWGNAFNEELVQGLKRGQLDASRIIDAIVTDLARIALFRGVTQPLFGAIQNGATYLFGGQGQAQNANYFQFGGQRAAGGPVSAGMAYLIGERGPEVMVTGQSGTVIPNNALGGINITIAPVINAPTDGAVIQASILQSVALARSEFARLARVGALS